MRRSVIVSVFWAVVRRTRFHRSQKHPVKQLVGANPRLPVRGVDEGSSLAVMIEDSASASLGRNIVDDPLNDSGQVTVPSEFISIAAGVCWYWILESPTRPQTSHGRGKQLRRPVRCGYSSRATRRSNHEVVRQRVIGMSGALGYAGGHESSQREAAALLSTPRAVPADGRVRCVALNWDACLYCDGAASGTDPVITPRGWGACP
jgi:hypothetical protein